MLIPFQRILCCSRPERGHISVILVASGASIYSFRVTGGKLLSLWTALSGSQNLVDVRDSEIEGKSDGQEPPQKKRRLSSEDVSDAPSAEIVTDSVTKRRRRPKLRILALPSISALCVTSDGRHVVAVTGEDKCIRVLKLLEDGSLKQVNEHVVPKRPSAVALSPDEKIILCGDKFGDVYALPLLQNNDFVGQLEDKRSASSEPNSGVKTEIKPFVPAANHLTVHTKKNQEALRNQQISASQYKERKKADRGLQPILGHVSLLTNLLSVALRHETAQRSYIISSDRDEHIRISRGIPQAHIIEGYCLGHSKFITKLCVPSWRPDVLISGGGDDYIVCWDWLSGTIKKKIDVKLSYEAAAHAGSKGGEDADSPIAVSGIWALQTGDQVGQVIVACEGVPALFTYSLSSDGDLTYTQTLYLDHNVLDVTLCNDQLSIFYSLDNVHSPCSTTRIAHERDGNYMGCHQYDPNSNTWVDLGDCEVVNTINSWARAEALSPGGDADDLSALSDMYYGLEHLRKRENSQE